MFRACWRDVIGCFFAHKRGVHNILWAGAGDRSGGPGRDRSHWHELFHTISSLRGGGLFGVGS